LVAIKTTLIRFIGLSLYFYRSENDRSLELIYRVGALKKTFRYQEKMTMNPTYLIQKIRQCNPEDADAVDSILLYPLDRRYHYDDVFIAAMTTHNYKIASWLLLRVPRRITEDHSNLFFDFIQSSDYREGDVKRNVKLAHQFCDHMKQYIKNNPRLTLETLFDVVNPFFTSEVIEMFSEDNDRWIAIYKQIMTVFPRNYHRLLYTSINELNRRKPWLIRFLNNVISFGNHKLLNSHIGLYLCYDHMLPFIVLIYRLHHSAPGLFVELRDLMCRALNANQYFSEFTSTILSEQRLYMDPKVICDSVAEASVVESVAEDQPPMADANYIQAYHMPPTHYPIPTTVMVDPVTEPTVDPVTEPMVDPVTSMDVDGAEHSLTTLPTAIPFQPVVAERERMSHEFQVSDPNEVGVRLEKPAHYLSGGRHRKTKKRKTTRRRLKTNKNKNRVFPRKH